MWTYISQCGESVQRIMDSKNIKFKGTEDCGPRSQNKEVFMNVLVGHEVSFMDNDE